MAASGVSGKSGTFSGVTAEMIEWRLERTCFIGAYGSNESGEGTSKVAGRKDAKGTATFKTAPDKAPGTTVSAVLSNSEKTYTCSIIVSSVSAVCDANTGDVNTYEMAFEVDGAVTEAAAS